MDPKGSKMTVIISLQNVAGNEKESLDMMKGLEADNATSEPVFGRILWKFYQWTLKAY
ncbi:MAG: hypothetical protein KKG95_03980 [Candidatus Omnitrophica bacterium]|nr:hypothetical protein [Candidatus Omnitrophota bacterium]